MRFLGRLSPLQSQLIAAVQPCVVECTTCQLGWVAWAGRNSFISLSTLCSSFTEGCLTELKAPHGLHLSLRSAPPQQGGCAPQNTVQPHRSVFNLAGVGSDAAKQHQERRLIGYSPEQIYSVVADVEHYKEFVPWCQRSVVVDIKSPSRLEAELEVGFKVFVERYTSDVVMSKPQKIESVVTDSTLFNHLDSIWEFKPGPTPNSCWLTYKIDFAFKSPLYAHLASVFFSQVAEQMTSAFIDRCKHLYGPGAFDKNSRRQL